MNKATAVVLGIVIALLLRYMWSSSSTDDVDTLLGGIDVPDVMTNSAGDYGDPEIVKVSDNIFVAVGYSFSTVTMLVGDDGVVIVDTTDNTAAAGRIAEAFREITTKPVKVIIYTHHHADHINGAKAFVIPDHPEPEVWAHHNVIKEQKMIYASSTAHIQRASFQFGAHVGKYRAHKVFAGSESLEAILRGEMQGAMPPTRLINGDTAVTVSGMEFTVICIPGETTDQIGVWYPESRTLLCADDLYKAFPNLYAIRGTQPRDVNDWVNSLDKMRLLRPKCLLSGHYRPVCGEDEVQDILISYKSAVQYVHDQTVRYINKGMHPEEIAKKIKLPSELANHPFLGELYGTVPWSVKGIFNSYLGWFSGDAVDLNPLTPSERNERIVKLVGTRQLLKASEAAFNEGDYQWALELATFVFQQDENNSEALRLRRAALRKLAGLETSSNGRLYLMSSILNDAGHVPQLKTKNRLMEVPIDVVFQNIRYKINPENIPEKENACGCFHFSDTEAMFCLHLQNRVLNLLSEAPKEWTFKLTTTEKVFREIIAGIRSAAKAYMTGDISVEGGISNVRNFMGYLDT